LEKDPEYIERRNAFVDGVNNGFNLKHESWTKICDRFMFDLILQYLNGVESTLYQELYGNPWNIYIDNLNDIRSSKNKNLHKKFYRCLCENFGMSLLDRISNKRNMKFL